MCTMPEPLRALVVHRVQCGSNQDAKRDDNNSRPQALAGGPGPPLPGVARRERSSSEPAASTGHSLWHAGGVSCSAYPSGLPIPC